jgi:hypothetical protein
MKFLRFSMISLCAAIFGMVDANAADPCKVIYKCDNGMSDPEPREYEEDPFKIESAEICTVPDGKEFGYWYPENDPELKLYVDSEYSCDGIGSEVTIVAIWNPTEDSENQQNPINPVNTEGQDDPENTENPDNTEDSETPAVATVSCGAGSYLPAHGTSESDCLVCPYGYFCPHDGLYVAGASVAQGAYACLPGAVQSLDRKSCKVSLTTNQLLYGVAGGTTKCWLLKEAANYVNCIYGGYHKPQL